VAPMMFPTKAMIEEPMKNQRRPKTKFAVRTVIKTMKFEDILSESLPTRENPIVNPSVQAKATQVIFGEPPKDALIRESVLAGNTHPR